MLVYWLLEGIIMHAELANVEVGMEANRQMQDTLAKRQSCHLYKCSVGARA